MRGRLFLLEPQKRNLVVAVFPNGWRRLRTGVNASVRGEGNRPLEDGHAHEPHSFYHYFPRMEQVRAWIADERCRTAASVCSTTTGWRSSAFRSARRSWSRR